MTVRMLRHSDVEGLREILRAEVATLPPRLCCTLEAAEEFIHSHLDTGGFGLVVLGGEGLPLGCYLGRVVTLPAATRPIIADVFFSANCPGVMDAIAPEIAHLARLWDCPAYTLSVNSRKKEVVERWGLRYGMRHVTTVLMSEPM